MLTQEVLKECFSYNPKDGLFIRIKLPNKYCNQKIGDISGSKMADGYLSICINSKHHKAHRLAWLYVYGEFPEHEIDHINGIRDDNRIENLRVVTTLENSHNRRIAHKTNVSTGLLGVHYYKITGRYVAKIRIGNKKRIHLGYFDTKEQAHSAYLKAKRELHNTCTI